MKDQKDITEGINSMDIDILYNHKQSILIIYEKNK